jgi:alkane 1-monooxygenase
MAIRPPGPAAGRNMPEALKDLRFLIALTVPAMPVVGYLRGDNYHAFLVSFLFIPVLDWMLGLGDRASAPREITRLERGTLFRAILFAYVPMHLGLIMWGARVVGHGELATLQSLGLALSIGVVTGAQGITIAHELGHKRSALDRLLAQVLLVTVSYGHFTIEHNRGHHVRVATPEDPASARYGESFWAFLPRTLAGSYAHAWRLELERMQGIGASPWSWRNAMLWYAGLPPAIALALGVAFGPWAALFFFVQSAMAIALLEAVNYIEHYGLARARGADGRYERFDERHAWDADNRLTNAILIHLPRHADHHLAPTRPYQALQPRAGSPKLPSGYAAMLPLALVPPLWFRVVNPRVPQRGA